MARPVQVSPSLLLVVVVALFAAVEVAAQDGSCSASSPCPATTNCCSQYGYCGTGAAYCGKGCKNGPCIGTAPPPPPPPAQSGSCSASSPCPATTNCCSQYGYCGTGAAYCGTGCKNGPCTGTPTPTPPSSLGGAGWSSFFTESDFNSWFPSRNSFYTFQAFSLATSAYPAFGTSGSTDDRKREIAAFFGNVQQESGGLQYINEINPPNNYCQANNAQYPCAAGKSYYGRGPIQLSWNYNYGACGAALGLNLLANPDQVAQNGGTAFKTAMWFWMTNGCHAAILRSSFASTIRVINGALECGHGFDQRVENRVNAYVKFCGKLQVNPGTDLRC